MVLVLIFSHNFSDRKKYEKYAHIVIIIGHNSTP